MEKSKTELIIAVDFDGTIVKHEYPEIGESVPYAFEVLKELVNRGHKLILFTMRSNKPYIEKIKMIDLVTNKEMFKIVERNTLQEAIDFCSKNGIHFYGINSNPTQKLWTKSPKAYAHIYIDDAALGCPLIYDKHSRPYVDWLAVKDLLINQENN